MKEIIYLDTDLINSLIAQLDEGLIINFSMEQWGQQVDTEGGQTSRSKNAGFSGSVQTGTGSILPGWNLNFGTNIGSNGNETTMVSRSILESQKDILNKAFHDYSLEILINKLKEEDLLHTDENSKEGDFCLVEKTYKFYDFELINNIMDIERVSKFIMLDTNEEDFKEAQRIIKKTNPTTSDREKRTWALNFIEKYTSNQNSINGLKMMELVSGYFAKSLRNVSFIKTDNILAILKNDFLRETPETLSLRPDKGRKVKILARINGKKNNINSSNFNGNFNPEDFDAIPGMIFDVMLGAFKIIENNDTVVTPIAIYYE